MKKIKIIVSIAFIISAATACKKFVDYDPHEDYITTTADYFKSASDYQSLVVGCYTPLQWIWADVMIGDIATDNAVSGGENATDVLGLQQIDDYTIVSNNSYLTETWKSCFEGINRVNYLQENKGLLNFTGKDALYGEVYFLRAYYYFELVKLFGDVPLFVDHRLTVTDSKTLSRTAKADVYKQIELDLANAIAVLPTTNAEKGRVTKNAAYALLGKVYLYENKFDAAAAALENVINSGTLSLLPNFQDIFLQAGENGPESVFEIQYTNLSNQHDYGTINFNRSQGNIAVQYHGVRSISGSSPYAEGYSCNLPTQELAKQYTTGDKRKDATILDIEAYKKANPSFNITYTVAPYKNTGLYNNKYQPRQGESSSAGVAALNYLTNFRTIRYADVLLMAAEANNRATAANDTKALTYLNLVRRRAFGDVNHDVTATGATLKQAIWDERRLELAMEGDRFFDLVRTGQAAAKITNFKVGTNEVFPIPQQEIDNSGLSQNHGY
ncbi:RagB/SusD family nutrient uptake outer membrane protein [Parasediminibacterium sp. JCM 36343]|uniref:RagB/SusD family nutrient uptake outer membrane protein n=1 Tax=Parasediminibacterium sp. JCM 36343 TaxID=3374279 RepID=UPI00397B3697